MKNFSISVVGCGPSLWGDGLWAVRFVSNQVMDYLSTPRVSAATRELGDYTTVVSEVNYNEKVTYTYNSQSLLHNSGPTRPTAGFKYPAIT